VALLLARFPAASVVDLGCGIGAWLRAFERNGVTDYLGLDGDYVSAETLLIPADRFRAVDIPRLSDVGRRFDIACSLEVAEHLLPECAARFVALLTQAAPVVLFSAAIPRQGGVDHVNEQWQSYWAGLFASHGYVALDCIRPAVFGNPDVEWWYRQNTLVYCDRNHVPNGLEPVSDRYVLDRADPGMIEAMLQPGSIRTALSAIARDISALNGAIGRKVSGRRKASPN
jgi:SAM-dependent methyltransferase